MKTSGPRLASNIVLDSSAYSHLRGGDERVVRHLAAADSILVPAIVVGELEAAFASGARTRANQQVLEDFLAEPAVHVIDVDRQVARQYARILSRLRRAGTPVGVNVIWIAATAMEAA